MEGLLPIWLKEEAIQVNEFIRAVWNCRVQTRREGCHVELLTGVHYLGEEWQVVAVSARYNYQVVCRSMSVAHDVNDDLDINIPSLLTLGSLLKNLRYKLPGEA